MPWCREIKLFDVAWFYAANLWRIELTGSGKFRMIFRGKPVSIMGASPSSYIYMHKKVALVTRKFFLNLLSSKQIPPASGTRMVKCKSKANTKTLTAKQEYHYTTIQPKLYPVDPYDCSGGSRGGRRGLEPRSDFKSLIF